MLKSFSGNAVRTVISSNFGVGDTQLSLQNSTGWPDGSGGPIPAMLTRSADGAQEKVLLSNISSGLATVSARGHDGTTEASFAAGDSIEHIFDAETVASANAYIAAGHLPLSGGALTGNLTVAGEVFADGVLSQFSLNDADAPPSSYPNGLSFSNVSVTGNFPDFGVVLTVNQGESYRTFQVFHENQSTPTELYTDRVWRRNWVPGTSSWGPWRGLNEFVGLVAHVGSGQATVAGVKKSIAWTVVDEQYPLGGLSNDGIYWTVPETAVYSVSAVCLLEVPAEQTEHTELRILSNSGTPGTGEILQQVVRHNGGNPNRSIASLAATKTMRLQSGQAIFFEVTTGVDGFIYGANSSQSTVSIFKVGN